MKNSDSPEARLVTLVLSPLEAEQLDAFLDKAAADFSTDFERYDLEVLHERLQDARALARWLRENVFLDLSPREGANLNELLVVHLIQQHSQQTSDALLATRTQLRSKIELLRSAPLAFSAADG